MLYYIYLENCTSCTHITTKNEKDPAPKKMSVRLTTSHGVIDINLHWKETPRTCRNFIELAKHGYFDGIIFHRLVPGFVAQTGDPYGDGRGGESIYGAYFDDEIVAKLSHNRRGVVSMANAGRNTNSSQFFLAFDELPHLDGKHTVFGQITDDTLGILDDIENVKLKKKKPVVPIKIFSASVLTNPWEDKPLPQGACIPEKPLVDAHGQSNLKKVKKNCSIM